MACRPQARRSRTWPVVQAFRPSRPTPAEPRAIRRVIQEIGNRANRVVTLEAIRPLHVLYTDCRELLVECQRQKAYLMPLLDHASKYMVGWFVAMVKNTTLAAWSRARRNLAHSNIDLGT